MPDPDLPFLGIHLTRMIDGSVTVGPNAVLGLSREGYRKLAVNVRDVAQYLFFPGLWRVLARYRKSVRAELTGSLLKSAYLRGVPQVLSDPDGERSVAVHCRHPRPGGDEGR